jgi:hypothetical protein
LTALVAHVDPVIGDIKFCSEDGQELAPPTEELGLAKLVHWPSRWLGFMTKGHWLGRKRSGT